MSINRLVDSHQLKSCINDSIILIAHSVYHQLRVSGRLVWHSPTCLYYNVLQ